jgi:hypothetical protein
MKTDYGFCWNMAPRPTIQNSSFPLYHRDRYDARILGVRPNSTYYVRAYARNSQGISYSTEELTVKTPASVTNDVKPLLSDKFNGNWVIDRFHGNATTSDGYFVGSGAFITLLKLTTYYRAPLNNIKPAYDLTRIHISPTLSRPVFRMQEFYNTLGECVKLAQAAKMQASTFPPGFDREFTKFFNLKSVGKDKPVQPFAEKDIPTLIPQIRKMLGEAKPVVVVQESIPLSPRQHGLSWVIIDGYEGEDRFHLDYPRGCDRDFKTRTGWYTLNQLFKDVKSAYIILNFVPLKY